MVSDYTIQEKVQKLEDIHSHEEQLYKILELYMEIFPIRNSILFRFSPLGYLGEGIISLGSSGLKHVREMRDDIRSVPIIHSAIQERAAKYCTGIEYFKQTGSRYIFPSSVSSMVITPICFGTMAIGYICSTEFEDESLMDEQMLSSFTLFGKLVGHLIEIFNNKNDSHILSNRELEVMRRISWGESTKEMANAMHISDLTIKQYVKSAIKKLGVRNRPHAVGELIRMGIIS